MAQKRTKKKTTSKSKPQRKRGSGAMQALKTFMIVILVLGIIAAAGYCTWRFWLKDYLAEGKIFTVEVNGQKYENGASGLLIAPDSEWKVTTPHGKDYEVKIYASDKTNFSFKLGAEPWEWKSMQGSEFTSGFAITPTSEGFRMSYEGLNGIIEKVHGQEANVLTNEIGDIFDLVLMCGKQELRISFGTYLPVTGVELGQDEFYFVFGA